MKMNFKILLLLLLAGCFAEEREAIKAAFSPASKQEEKKDPPKKELTIKVPDEWKICETLRATAKNLAPGCWEEVANGCVKGEVRATGECPTCDGLDRVNIKLANEKCFMSKEDQEKKDSK